jgi:hypothetical protein
MGPWPCTEAERYGNYDGSFVNLGFISNLYQDMTTIILEIFPAFDPSCYFKLDRQSSTCSLTVQINAPGKNKWDTKVDNFDKVNSVEVLARKVVSEAAQDHRIILDGVGLKCTTIENGITEVHEFRCPEPGTNELILTNIFFALVQEFIHDQLFINYIELIEGYFANNLPVKIFQERPLRLRIYGSMSTYEKAGLTGIIENILNENEITIDMTNFVGMGTILYNCFRPLDKIPKLTFLANENAVRHIEAMGFGENIVTHVKK